MQRFGTNSPISFRFIHDFTYGFDWSRWARRNKNHVNPQIPFNLMFLRYLQNRSYEITQLIRDNDHEYPKLKKGERRNPFFFSREPKDEIKLYETLAAENSIPIQCWQLDAIGRTDLDFTNRRRQAAFELGIQKREGQNT